MNPIQYQTIELWQNLSDADTGKIYQKALLKSWQLLQQIGRLLFLLFLLVAAICIWVWSVGFQSGRLFRQWLNVEEPTPQDIVLKFSDTLLLPLKVGIVWLEAEIKKAFDWDLNLSALMPATKDKSLPEATETTHLPAEGNKIK
jgi:hypothetical protein